jgi:hypothetical protein
VRQTWIIDPDWPESEDLVPVRGFAGRAAAEACQQELEQHARRRFDCIPLFKIDLSDSDYEHHQEFRAALERIGPPLESVYAMLPWWQGVAGTLTREQRDALWEAAPDLRIYQIVVSRLAD